MPVWLYAVGLLCSGGQPCPAVKDWGGMEPGYLVVVPGIRGTELAVPGDRSSKIWTAGFGNIGKFLARPDRLSLSEHPRLQPVGLIKTRKAFGIWTAIHGYHGLLHALTAGESALPGARLDDGTVLPGLQPGLYDVTVVAEDVPGAGDLQIRETVEVVEDDDLD